MESKRKHKFVVIEGIDGVGKTSVAEELVSHLRGGGQPAVVAAMPPEELVGAAGYMNRKASTKAHYLFYLAVVKHVSDRVQKLLEEMHVICARYLLTTLAYHWAADANIRIEIADLQVLPPDLTVLLCCAEEERRRRLDRRKSSTPGDELCLTEGSVLERIELLYRELDENLVEVDTTGRSPSQIAQEIAGLLCLPDG